MIGVDVTRYAAVEAARAATVAVLGKIDILVNGAGIAGRSRRFSAFTPEEGTR